MKGLAYLRGQNGNRLHWWEVTRDERFFCAHLYRRILEYDGGISYFIEIINSACDIQLPTNSNWELGFEVCFYRDLWWHYGKKFELHSPKRTFDLCLLSDDKIVIIEAKAFESFKMEQLEKFGEDKNAIKKIQKLNDVEVSMLGLSSSKCASYPEIFENKLLTWKQLSESYNHDPVLKRADDIHGYTGADLLDLADQGHDFLVGCKGGIKALEKNAIDWQSRTFQTNMLDTEPPNRNWFRLAEFAEVFRKHNIDSNT